MPFCRVNYHMGGPHKIIEWKWGSSRTLGKHITYLSSQIHLSEWEYIELSGRAGGWGLMKMETTESKTMPGFWNDSLSSLRILLRSLLPQLSLKLLHLRVTLVFRAPPIALEPSQWVLMTVSKAWFLPLYNRDNNLYSVMSGTKLGPDKQ